MRSLVVGMLLLAGCKSPEKGAREHFAREVTCPLERVEARARTDVKPGDWIESSKPPKDVAADPERLQMWKAKDEERRSWANRDQIIEVRGCGKQKLYACHRHNKDANYIMCSDLEYLPDMTHW